MIPTRSQRQRAVETNAPRTEPQSASFRLTTTLLAGLPLAFLSSWIILRMEQPENYATPTGLTIYYPVVTLFALMLLLNKAIGRLFGEKWRLSRAELLCIYAMMGMGCAYVCWENLGILVPSLAFPSALPSRPEAGSDWMRQIVTHLPAWALVKDPQAALALLQGGQFSALWRGWLLPLVGWGALMSVLFLMYMALTRLFYRPWVHHERLTLPLTRLPLEMTDPKATLWKSRLFWGGFAGSALLDLWNGLATLYPGMPLINVKVTWFNMAPDTPAWEAVGPIPLNFHPLMIGLAFLLPTDLLFSTWFFYALSRVELYAAGSRNLARGVPYMFADNVPGVNTQCFGALLVLGVSWLWSARRHLALRWQEAREGDRTARVDYGLLAVGSVVLLWMFFTLGLPLWAGVLTLAILIILALFVTRLRAELGLPVHNLQFLGPDGPMIAAFGGEALGKQALIGFGSLYALTRSQQGHPMPHQMEAAYMAEQCHNLRGRFWWALAIAGLILTLLMPWLFLGTLSVYGLEGGHRGYHRIGMEGWTQLSSQLNKTSAPNVTTLLETGVGVVVTLFLLWLRHTWFGSPFHPVGYALSGSWSTMMVSSPLFFAWLLKVLLTRYGGMRTYKAALPLALGVVMGEFTIGTFWEVFALFTGVQPYRIWMF